MAVGLPQFLTLLKKAYTLLKAHDPLLLSSSTAFFATFALSPILIIFMDFLGIFFPEQLVHEELFTKIEIILGTGTANDIQKIVHGFESQERNLLLSILITLFYYFVATTLLGAIKHSIQQLWNLKQKPGNKIIYYARERLTGIALLFFAAVLVMIAYLIDRLLHSFHDNSFLFYFLDTLGSIAIATIWFSLVFKLLPEARIRWNVAISGGLFTAVLLTGGEFLLGKFLGHGKLADIFGVSSTMALLLLFIFYCSFILYLGASFTYVFSRAIRSPVEPGKYGARYREEGSETRKR